MSIKFRDGADKGQWASFLLPACLFPLILKSVSFADKLTFATVTELSILHAFGRVIYLENFFAFDSHNVFNALFAIPVSAFASWFTSTDIIFTYPICITAIWSYNYLISKMLINFSGSFTLGEAQTIAQGIIAFVLHSLISLKQLNQHFYGTFHEEAMVLLKLLFLGLLLLVCCLYIVPNLRNGLKMLYMSFNFALLMILLWTFCYQKNLFVWFLEFCTYGNKRMYLLSFWLILTVTSVLYVMWINHKPGYTATSLDRKYFHFIINGVFISGIFCDIQFLCFASGIALGAFIVLEMFRLLDVLYIGATIGQAFRIFLDEKDSGMLILTHIYLLIGCSCPIWLSAYYVNRNTYHICLLSGIISVGFGDTFAAIGGTLFGKHRWKGSMKTLEGTACAIIVQLACSFFFLYVGHPLSVNNITLVVTSVVLTSILEAKTTQVDNLVLPLFMFSFLSWIK